MRLFFLLIFCCSLVCVHAQTENDAVAQKNSELRLLRFRAAKGGPEAQLNLGKMYSFGQGAPKNDAEAAIWVRKAAEQGNAEAQYLLGVYYGTGLGVPKDEVEALKWTNLASAQGYSKAQEYVGVLHQAAGTTQGDVAAVKAYRKSAA